MGYKAIFVNNKKENSRYLEVNFLVKPKDSLIVRPKAIKPKEYMFC